MFCDTQKKIGIFLGRLQPQHKGHEMMIKRIFKENDEVVLCIGSAQKISKTDAVYACNPLSKNERVKRLNEFLKRSNFAKPYKVVTAKDIEPDEAWPAHLKHCCRLTDATRNTIYFGDQLSDDYKHGLELAGFNIKIVGRKSFLYKTREDKLHEISSATEIRNLEKQP